MVLLALQETWGVGEVGIYIHILLTVSLRNFVLEGVQNGIYGGP